jgi:catechol 2,3-dioxygenase-like lactoylglutathione lyase family enzyme
MSSDKNYLDRAGAVLGFDHVSLPMKNTGAMIAFYRSLGLEVAEHKYLVQVYLGDHMINFHRPELWQAEAHPPCGDLCVVWQGSAKALSRLLDTADAVVVEGPVAREGARRVTASSVYVRDPDGNLIEFMTYPDITKEHADIERA